MEFYTLGKHCEHPLCHQQDFLPMQCKYCKHHFCTDHHPFEEHKCQHFETLLQQSTIPQCPLCSELVAKRFPQEDNNVVIERHIQSHCKVMNPLKASSSSCSQKNCCQFKKCKQDVMTTCKSCGLQLCLDHRFDSDHQCQSNTTNKSTTSTMKQKQDYVLKQQAKQVKQLYKGYNNEDSFILLDKRNCGHQVMKKRSTNEKIRFANTKQQVASTHYKPNLQAEDVTYLDVFFPLESQYQPLHCLFPKQRTIGKLIDVLCEQASILQSNLYKIYLLRNRSLLPTNQTLNQLLQQNILQSGDSILIEKQSVAGEQELHPSILSQMIQLAETKEVVASCSAAAGHATSSNKWSQKISCFQ